MPAGGRCARCCAELRRAVDAARTGRSPSRSSPGRRRRRHPAVDRVRPGQRLPRGPRAPRRGRTAPTSAPSRRSLREHDGRPHWGKLHTRDRRRPADRPTRGSTGSSPCATGSTRDACSATPTWSGCWDEGARPADARAARRRRRAGAQPRRHGRRLPGARLRPHVKAHKCTALARGRPTPATRAFTCATIREVRGHGRAPGSATTCCSPTRCSTPAGSARWSTAGAGHGRGRLAGDARRRRGAAGSARCSSTSTSACRAAAARPSDAGRLADLARARRARRCAASWATRATSCCSPDADRARPA